MVIVYKRGIWARTRKDGYPSDRFELRSSSGGTLLVVRRTDGKIVTAYAAGEWRAAIDTPDTK